MDNFYLKKNGDLAACPIGKNFQIALVWRSFRLIGKGERPKVGEHVPRVRDFVILTLLHHWYPLFQPIYKLRLLYARLRR